MSLANEWCFLRRGKDIEICYIFDTVHIKIEAALLQDKQVSQNTGQGFANKFRGTGLTGLAHRHRGPLPVAPHRTAGSAFNHREW